MKNTPWLSVFNDEENDENKILKILRTKASLNTENNAYEKHIKEGNLSFVMKSSLSQRRRPRIFDGWMHYIILSIQ